MTVRVLGGTWFLLLALPGGLNVFTLANSADLSEFSSTGWPALLSSLCLLLFYLTLFWLVLHRPSPWPEPTACFLHSPPSSPPTFPGPLCC